MRLRLASRSWSTLDPDAAWINDCSKDKDETATVDRESGIESERWRCVWSDK